MEYIAVVYGESVEEAQDYLSYNSYYFRSSKPQFIMEVAGDLYAFRVDLVGAHLEDVRVIAVEPTGKNDVDIRRWM